MSDWQQGTSDFTPTKEKRLDWYCTNCDLLFAMEPFQVEPPFCTKCGLNAMHADSLIAKSFLGRKSK